MPRGIYIRTEAMKRNLSLAHMGIPNRLKGINTLPYCADCKIKLKDHRSIKCRSCAGRERMLGKKMTKETRLKMSKSRKGDLRCGWAKGTHLSLEHRLAISKTHKQRVLEGKNNFWKGGIYPQNLLERVKFRQQIQKLVFERDDYTCQFCGSKTDLQVDHIQSWADHVDLRFNMDNCRTLCSKCHYKITYGRDMPDNARAWGRNFSKIERKVL